MLPIGVCNAGDDTDVFIAWLLIAAIESVDFVVWDWFKIDDVVCGNADDTADCGKIISAAVCAPAIDSLACCGVFVGLPSAIKLFISPLD